MKRIVTILSVTLIIFSCHKKTVPVITERKAEPPKVPVFAYPPKETVAADTITGKRIFTNRCGRCHALKQVDNYTAERWNNILKAMIPKAKLNETEAQQVTAYVMEYAKRG